MKSHIKDTLEMQWIPAISTMIIILTCMFTCFCWTVSRIDQQSTRTDKLYEMFIDLLKEGRK